MTKKRYDDASTEFGLWLREQPELDSIFEGFNTTNLDYIWENYKTGQVMLIEEKRHGSSLKFPQSKLLQYVHKYLGEAPGYCGFFLITFEKTSPEDGKVYISDFFKKPQKKYEVSNKELLQFLRFVPLDDIIEKRST